MQLPEDGSSGLHRACSGSTASGIHHSKGLFKSYIDDKARILLTVNHAWVMRGSNTWKYHHTSKFGGIFGGTQVSLLLLAELVVSGWLILLRLPLG